VLMIMIAYAFLQHRRLSSVPLSSPF
jgi:hypothetical protein